MTTQPPMMIPDLLAYSLDGKGGAVPLAPQAVAQEADLVRKGGFVWQHMKRDHPDTPALLAACDLDSFVVDALTADETRPRCTVHGKGMLLNLRGVNLNPGAEPEDMVSVRLWLEERRVIGVWVRPLQATNDLVAATERGEGPMSPGDLVAKLALRLADRAEPSVAALNEQIDDLEDGVWDLEADNRRTRLADLRRSAIVLRRYFLPQRDALMTLEIEDARWLTVKDRAHLREAAERVNRFGEELDAIRDRAQIVHDQIMDQRAEGLNQRMLVLSVVAAIFLPLGLLTGLLGINVGGVPGADNPYAFVIVCVLLVVLGVGLAWWFRRIGMLK
ncbi:zinc transporter ZntB [Yoonia sp.]|uniref:zinc transporter ZntB n=1 Tax=Yoonia sp. TaxID=2212373 RepID=UPI003F4A8E65